MNYNSHMWYDFDYAFLNKGGRDSSVGITIGYGLDGPRSNPGTGEIFRTRPDWS
jgi:hypothetical protein